MPDSSSSTASPPHSVAAWIADARARLRGGAVTEADLDALEALTSNPPKQRLLYMHAAEPNLFAEVVACNLIEPSDDYMPAMSAEEPQVPYFAVLDAVKDGWHIVHFPQLQLDARESAELSSIGYEFILQKLEYQS